MTKWQNLNFIEFDFPTFVSPIFLVVRLINRIIQFSNIFYYSENTGSEILHILFHNSLDFESHALILVLISSWTSQLDDMHSAKEEFEPPDNESDYEKFLPYRKGLQVNFAKKSI